MWPEPTESTDSPPESWTKLLDHVLNHTMYQEALQSAPNIALLIRDPVHRRAFAWARAEQPCPVSAPSPQTLRRLRANTVLKKAAEDGVAVLVTSRELCDVDPEIREQVVRSNEMPINLPKNWADGGWVECCGVREHDSFLCGVCFGRRVRSRPHDRRHRLRLGPRRWCGDGGRHGGCGGRRGGGGGVHVQARARARLHARRRVRIGPGHPLRARAHLGSRRLSRRDRRSATVGRSWQPVGEFKREFAEFAERWFAARRGPGRGGRTA